MNKNKKMAVKVDGLRRLYDIERDPDSYFAVLGTHLYSQTLFGRLIRWWERSLGSHSKTTYIHKATGLPYVDVHALEGWGYIASEPSALVTGKTVCEYRLIKDVTPTSELIAKHLARLQLRPKYQRPLGFVTKSRKDDPAKWFCSEDVNNLHGLQNCESFLVSPPWCRRSVKCREIYGWLYGNGHFELNKEK